MVNINKVLYLLILLLFPALVFAQTGQTAEGTIAKLVEQLVPQGYYLLAEGFGIPTTGALVIFFLVWFLASGLIWIGVQKALGEAYKPSQEKGYILFSFALGGLVTYGIGLWGGTFVLMLSIVSGLTIIFIGLIVYRTFSGAAAGFEKFELKLKTERSKARKSFLEVDKNLKQLEMEYRILCDILSREAGWLGGFIKGRFKKLLEDISEFKGFAERAKASRNLKDIIDAIAKAGTLKSELNQIKVALPENSEVLKHINNLEKIINSTEDSLKEAYKNTQRMIKESKEVISTIVKDVERDLNYLDEKIEDIEGRIIKTINEIIDSWKEQGIIAKKSLNNLNEELKKLSNNIEKLKEDIQKYEKGIGMLRWAANELQKTYLIPRLRDLWETLEKYKQELEVEHQELKKKIPKLDEQIRKSKKKISKEQAGPIIEILESIRWYLGKILKRHRILKDRLLELCRELYH